ncbi:hypothetical protein F5984_18785 [Rudanella paleaurantiibacter]|uniref:Uncharacterized protein n=1 Tax=Rudanella paleaurantiibacter TaxID=2614655 RepID=A0A7J5TWF5_9BACT|nr:hypothetical protein [Rudanella paleaurantiibacter]KAB7728418.1 hypothetical protein F5984_18785 [Rudanella paleaurantiibacter]
MGFFNRAANWVKEVATGKNKVLAFTGPVGLAFFIANQRTDQKAINQLNSIPGWADLPTAADIAAYEQSFNAETDNRAEFVSLQLKRLNELATRYQDKITQLANQKGITISQAAGLLGAGAGVAATLATGPFIPVTATLGFAFGALAKKASANEQKVLQARQEYVMAQLQDLSTLYTGYTKEAEQLKPGLPVWLVLVVLVLLVYLLKRKKRTE